MSEVVAYSMAGDITVVTLDSPVTRRVLDVEDSACPVVAAVHGMALAAGTEIALAGNYRVARLDRSIERVHVHIIDAGDRSLQGIGDATTGTARRV